MADLSSASLEYMKDFFRRYYAPNNAVIVVAGAARSDAVRLAVRQAFADIPHAPSIAGPIPPTFIAHDTVMVAEGQQQLPHTQSGHRSRDLDSDLDSDRAATSPAHGQPFVREHPPALGASPRLEGPVARAGRLANGLSVHVVKQHLFPLVQIVASLSGGSRLDGARPGIAAFTANNVDEGAGERGSGTSAPAPKSLAASAAGQHQSRNRCPPAPATPDHRCPTPTAAHPGLSRRQAGCRTVGDQCRMARRRPSLSPS